MIQNALIEGFDSLAWGTTIADFVKSRPLAEECTPENLPQKQRLFKWDKEQDICYTYHFYKDALCAGTVTFANEAFSAKDSILAQLCKQFGEKGDYFGKADCNRIIRQISPTFAVEFIEYPSKLSFSIRYVNSVIEKEICAAKKE